LFGKICITYRQCTKIGGVKFLHIESGEDGGSVAVACRLAIFMGLKLLHSL
jgi:hypothetical protein